MGTSTLAVGSAAGIHRRDRRRAARTPIAEVRNVRRKEHGPVPFEEQPRLARELRQQPILTMQQYDTDVVARGADVTWKCGELY
jgi:hypothetical protein